MKAILSLTTLCLLLGMTAMTLSGSQNRTKNENIQDRFVGAWRLAQLETQGADGKIHQADSTGLLVFTRDGHMSVQVMERNPHSQTAKQTSAEPEQYSQGGYEASFGTYQIDESTHTFTYHVEGALVRTLVGKDLPRAFALSGKQLIVQSTHHDEHWKATWEHY
jgi:Lipocalin-like domain